ncbi:MAG: hypothetical protein K2O91_18145 [Lachnospiraceae bacterium]|nr:hypothetical protein [Lachnospiraceae bacterium]
MGIEIDLNDLNISGNAEVMGNVRIRNSNDVHISLKHSDISENAKVLNNLEIDPILKELMQQIQVMDKDSLEYSRIMKILGVKQWNKNDFIGCVLKHISEFSQGVLASIVANMITK